MAKQIKTNATRILETKKIPFELLEYDIDMELLSAEDAAAKTGIPEERTFKTLCVRGDKHGILLACLPAGRELDFKALAAVSGNKSTELVPLKEVTPLTGYVRGGCSPIGMKKKFPTCIDETAILFDEIAVSAGMRGEQIVLSPTALADYVGAEFAALTA